MSDLSLPENVEISQRDMSRFVGKKRTSATIRKQRERAKLKKNQRRKVEMWISTDTQAVLQRLTALSGRGARSLMDMVMEHTGNEFLNRVLLAWEQVARHGELRQQFERYGFAINLQSTTPIRIRKDGVDLVLDPTEYLKAQTARLDIDSQLRKWGFDKEIVSVGGIKRYRARRWALKKRSSKQSSSSTTPQHIQQPNSHH